MTRHDEPSAIRVVVRPSRTEIHTILQHTVSTTIRFLLDPVAGATGCLSCSGHDHSAKALGGRIFRNEELPEATGRGATIANGGREHNDRQDQLGPAVPDRHAVRRDLDRGIDHPQRLGDDAAQIAYPSSQS